MMKLLFHGASIYLEGKTFGPACWPHHDLLSVKEGEVLFQTSKGALHLRAGDAVWIPPKLRFQGLVESKQTLIWVIHFQERGLNHKKAAVALEAGLGVFRGGIRSELALGLMERLHRLYYNRTWPPMAERYFSALLAELVQNASLHGDVIVKWSGMLEQWVRERLQTGIRVRDLAKMMNLSDSHFRKLFRRQQGVSAGKYLHDLRLNEARTLLQQSLLSLKQVSARVGYADAAAFNRAFSSHFKMTPLTFRRERGLSV